MRPRWRERPWSTDDSAGKVLSSVHSACPVKIYRTANEKYICKPDARLKVRAMESEGT
jgi:hypothetical protein